ncbi:MULTISPECIES: MarR family winged helix-turn-helix transcriptional regulator [Sphingopyxis]|jgi:DNA-binding MarR family transcriptional regulator|uniref:Transcriptional regulator, MarR family n=1 Tax=Sphingopyxis granuli TaxID=267128 RepID=A0AA86GLU3_9SPHN|nr:MULTISPECIES: MarR family transcriptional regulator [Sphingopyxis]AMG74476.1 Transcriptional regulator, MarR family [Sphingopyxis granuli]ODU29230.1 MAG: MarR family transcriptional regulator [Sphingopyxis sp. SCN 67-31]QUM71086.1 MarR family transcriptional regulator [Sphingopyxis granuli]
MPPKTLNLDQFLPYRLSIASNSLSSRIAAEYQSRFGLKIPEWRLMAVLGEGRPKTQRELVAATRMDKVTVNRAAKALADRNLIARQAHEADGRSHHLELTETGRSLYDAIVPAALATEARLESHISAAERATLMTILAKLTAAAEDYG